MSSAAIMGLGDDFMAADVAKEKKAKRNTARIGAERERKAKAILESQGYKVEQAPKVAGYFRGQVRSARHDFWECIDLIGVHPVRPTLYVQVGGVDDMRSKERDCTGFASSISFEHNTVSVWGFIGGPRPDGQRFRVTCWNQLEWAESEDQVCLATPRVQETAT